MLTLLNRGSGWNNGRRRREPASGGPDVEVGSLTVDADELVAGDAAGDDHNICTWKIVKGKNSNNRSIKKTETRENKAAKNRCAIK